MKTILYLQYFDPAAFPPLERSAQQFLDRGWKVHFLGIAPGKTYPKFATLQHPALSITLRRHRAGSIRDIAAYHLEALQMIAKLRPDVVYVSQERVALIGLAASLWPGIVTVLHEHDIPFLPGDRKTVVRFIRTLFARAADLCVLPQKRRAENFRRATGARRIMVAHNTPSLREIGDAPSRHDRDALILWHHGSLGPSRLPPALIQALTLLPERVSLRFAGYETVNSRGYIQELLGEAARLGIAGRVSYLGPMDRADLYSTAADCDVGVALFSRDFPQPMAGASNKPFDFLSSGLPLLTTDSPEWREFFGASGVSLFCDPDSAADIAEKLRWFSENPEARYQMALKSYDLIRREWNYEQSYSPVLAAIERSTRRIDA